MTIIKYLAVVLILMVIQYILPTDNKAVNIYVLRRKQNER